MYLKQIITSGFKSFADKLDINLDNKITCIVGPNGSGKSNIVDAVRWVLGEQSVKSLRGDGSMSDVIFSGSKSRKALNVASVELIFDNQDHYLNLGYNEISIKRKVYRNGENEYYLNNEKCRLKDITDLLIDSGVGKESFNIISQGEVQKIISNSSMDRRIIFEEAAGILKYKKRKEEALRKLDRTHNNIDRVNDIIKELEIQVEPLKEQSIQAKEYLENKEALEKYEVALYAYDIENFSSELKNVKTKKEHLVDQLTNIQLDVSSVDENSEKDEASLLKLEKTLADKNYELIDITEKTEKLNSDRQLFKERSKTKKSNDEIAEKMRVLLDDKGKLEGIIKTETTCLNNLKDQYNKKKIIVDKITKDIDKTKDKINMLNQNYYDVTRNINVDKQLISNMEVQLDNYGMLPNSVKAVLKEKSLDGIYDIISNVISFDDEYTKLIEIALSTSKNFIITKDETASVKAVEYLKKNNLGRATFFPLNVIKSRYIASDIIDRISHDDDFIDVVSNLVKYDNKYKNIIENQLGIVLATKDIDSANRLSKKIDNKYKIVTLDGDVVNVGGSISGGSIYKSSSLIKSKQDLAMLKSKVINNESILVNIKENIKQEEDNLTRLDELFYDENKALNSYLEEIDVKNKYIIDTKNKHLLIDKEWSDYNNIASNNIDDEELKIINLYNEHLAKKELLVEEIKSLNKEIDIVKDRIEEDRASYKIKNTKIRDIEKEIKECEIAISRYDVKLDHMLTTLSEDYSLTYEKAASSYHLDVDPKIARSKVEKYRSNIKKIGMVNLMAIEEYDRVRTRFDFLTNQRADLEQAEKTLLEIMNDMDEVMVDEFVKTFNAIEKEFKQVFKELFHGGEATLKLTNPNDILTTGIDIKASPPGKKLTTISLLSGGEKTFTAISLLFAILNVRTIPFCLFDEVEAALDDANVKAFGNYLDHYKDKTQFLIITHKKKTMEYADTLYGITMQESGVSKLVSVKLNNKEEVI